jgi:hypothetical protein
MDSLGFKNTKMWMGECGHASWHPVGHLQCKEGGGSEHRQAVWHLRRAFLDLKNSMALTSFFIIVDLWEKPYEKAVEVLSKPAAQGILNGITYTPKATHKALSNAAYVLSDKNEVIETFALIEGKRENPDIPPTTVCFEHNGKPCMAYWLGCPIEVEEIHDICYIVTNPMKKLKDPVVIDMLTGEVASIFTKKKLKMRAGETDKAVSFKDERLFALVERFTSEAAYRGQIDIDIFDLDGEYYISEVNPRFGGGYPHAYVCGCNHMKMIVNNLSGHVNSKTVGLYDEGVYMMKYSEIMINKG